jgi:hypothetical protein
VYILPETRPARVVFNLFPVGKRLPMEASAASPLANAAPN